MGKNSYKDRKCMREEKWGELQFDDGPEGERGGLEKMRNSELYHINRDTYIVEEYGFKSELN